MTDSPLKIMDEIECRAQHPPQYKAMDKVPLREWQSLRTALEAQAEALRLLKKSHENEENRTSLYADALHAANEELAQKEVRIARLESVMADEIQGRFGSRRYMRLQFQAALNESPVQSAAALQVETLRELL